jgi:predicted MFS family arabinose efflux permease
VALGLIRGHADFRRLWIGESISQLGGQISALGVPLTAIATLHASTLQVGGLTAAYSIAFVLLGLPAGAWVDRLAMRRVMIASDLVRAVVLGTVPLGAALGVLSLTQLYLVVFVTGLGTVFFDVAYLSYLPSLVGREHLVDGNARLEASRSAAFAAGPSISGLLVQALTAPVVILVDAVSFGWSAAWLRAIRTPEAAVPRQSRQPLRHEIGEGLRLVLRHPVLRALTLFGAVYALFWAVLRAVDVVFLVRTVHLSAAGIGLLFSCAGIGAVLGAFATPALRRRLGDRWTLLGTALTIAAFGLLVPLTGPGPRLGYAVAGFAVPSFCVIVFNIVAVSLRQTLCPDHLLGRMNATIRFLAWSPLPLGGLLGGVLGTAVGLRTTLWLGAGGGVLSVLCLILGAPLRSTGLVLSTGPVAVGAVTAESGG